MPNVGIAVPLEPLEDEADVDDDDEPLLELPELVVVPGSGSLQPIATLNNVAMDASTNVWIFISVSSHVRAGPDGNGLATAIDERLVDFHDDRKHIDFLEEVFRSARAHIGALQHTNEQRGGGRIESWTTSAIEREAPCCTFYGRYGVVKAGEIEVKWIGAQSSENFHLQRIARDSIGRARIALDEVDDIATRRSENAIDDLRCIEGADDVGFRARFAVSSAAFQVKCVLNCVGKLRRIRRERRNVQRHRDFVVGRPSVNIGNIAGRIHLDRGSIQVICRDGPSRARDNRERASALKISHLVHSFSSRTPSRSHVTLRSSPHMVSQFGPKR